MYQTIVVIMFIRRLKIKPNLNQARNPSRLRTTPCSSTVVGGIEKLSDISPLNTEVGESRTHSEIGNIDILGKEIKIEELKESGILECCSPQLTVPSEIHESISSSSETIVNHKEKSTSDIAPLALSKQNSGVISTVICDKVVETLLMRSTSLKTGKTPPDTPNRKKIVRFADALGLDLEAVRHFVEDEDAAIPQSAFADLKDSGREKPISLPWVALPGPTSTFYFVPQFKQPGAEPQFLERVRQQKVCLENAIVDKLKVTVIVRVLNLGFEKKLFARYTTTKWSVFTDVRADYVPQSCDGFSDKFMFTIHLPHLCTGQQLIIALRYIVNGRQEFWDNNNGSKYVLKVQSKTMDAFEGAPPRWVHHSRSHVESLKVDSTPTVLSDEVTAVVEPDKENKRPRRKKAKTLPDRNQMTMVDLIYYNPTDNPMKRPEKNLIALADTAEKGESTSTTVERNNNEVVVAPRVKIDEFGQIVIDEESLVIQHAVPKGISSITDDSETKSLSFQNRTTSKKWSSEETISFYRALLIMGTDFSLMPQLIKMRSRHELKLKYKNEEKKHAELVHKIVCASSTSDFVHFQQEVEDACDSDGSQKKKNRNKPAAPSAKKVTRVSSGGDAQEQEVKIDLDDDQGNKKRKKRKKSAQSQKKTVSKKGSISDNAEHQQEDENSCYSDARQGCKLRISNTITYSKQPAGSNIGIIPEPELAVETGGGNRKVCKKTQSSNNGVQISDDGLVLPKKPNNLYFESSERQNLHRELLFNQRIGKSVIGQKTELPKAMDKFRDDQKKKEMGQDNLKQAFQTNSAFEKKREEQANKLKRQEELSTKKPEVPQVDQPECPC